MRGLLCHCRQHLEAEDDAALGAMVREHLMLPWSLPKSRFRRSSRPVPTTSHTPSYTPEKSSFFDPDKAPISRLDAGAES
jgi:hypothetical protein